MNKQIIDRVYKEYECIINTKATIREIAKLFNVSKSTVHKDFSNRLIELDYEKYINVSKILKHHIDIRHIRGGEATRKKYLYKNNN